MSAIHRDPEGRKKADRNHASLVERLIEEAIERGEFDELAGRGRPLPSDEDDTYAGQWRVGFTILRNARIAPPWIEADREVRRLRDERARLLVRARRASPLMRRRYGEEMTELVEAHNRSVEQVNTQAPTYRQHRRRLDVREEIRRLDDVFGQENGS